FNQTPCSSGAVGPASAISYTFNARLHRRDDGYPVRLSEMVLERTRVPLAWDVDGAAAGLRGQSPVFSAPGLGSTGAYRDDKLWFPSQRHNGAANFAFVDGAVESSARPLGETWAWSYAPR
ncbi:MAG: H-X9-DG-CTERM domain-containing protein, partial [Phycisphaerales bacterium JB039]